MLRLLRLSLICVLGLALPGCRSTVEPASVPLDFTSDNAAITLTNSNPWPVYYAMMDPEFLALYDGVPCSDPTLNCQHVPANGSQRIPFTQIMGFSASSTKVLLWEYRLVPKNSGYEQRDFVSRTFTVR